MKVGLKSGELANPSLPQSGSKWQVDGLISLRNPPKINIKKKINELKPVRWLTNHNPSLEKNAV